MKREAGNVFVLLSLAGMLIFFIIVGLSGCATPSSILRDCSSACARGEMSEFQNADMTCSCREEVTK